MSIRKNESLLFLLRRFGFILGLITVLLFCYTLIRLLFYFSNISFFQNLSSSEVFWSFVWGLRFDIAVLFQINLLLIVLYSLPSIISHNKHVQLFLQIIFTALNFAFMGLALADTQYFPFSQQHINKGIIYLIGDTLALAKHLSLDYWWVLLLALALLFFLYRSYTWIFNAVWKGRLAHAHYLSQIFFLLAIWLVSLIVIRGGLQPKSIDIPHAQTLDKYEASLLILNAPFSFIKSLSQVTLEEKHYFQDKTELRKQVQASLCLQNAPKIPRVRNVVLIILESFGAEFIGVWNPHKTYTPFFDRLNREGGALFTNAYANAKRSIQSLHPLLAGMPNWMKVPLIKTTYVNSKYPRLGSILKKHKYRTLFLHGGHKGTMYFDKTTSFLGLDEYYGYEDFPSSARKIHDDGAWGIFDEPFFLYAVDMINKDTHRPFFAVLFSLSSHHPHTIPEQYQGKFPIGETPFYKSIAYTDHSLMRFFQKVQKQKWAKETLFVLTADHPPATNSIWSQNVLSRRRIPILFYQPGRDLSFMNTKRIAQQMDILPTILDFLNIKNEQLLPFGRSLFALCDERYVVIFDDPYYWLVTEKDAIVTTSAIEDAALFHFSGAPPSLALKKSKESRLNSARKTRLLKQLQAYIQHYNNGLLYNELLP